MCDSAPLRARGGRTRSRGTQLTQVTVILKDSNLVHEALEKIVSVHGDGNSRVKFSRVYLYEMSSTSKRSLAYEMRYTQMVLPLLDESLACSVYCPIPTAYLRSHSFEYSVSRERKIMVNVQSTLKRAVPLCSDRRSGEA